ncbi:MAG: orotate phosphoribosyltransferase [Acidobacteriota bacterium]|nr:orotate phosphoribosyltransferase [Blastocatellia bacterium]MDW8413366.1 orotate phosphoribosyltransferase [Acidobacteriota bacterium]
MNQQEVLELFVKRGALLEGHFLLSSGLHSSQYLQCALVLQYPNDAEQLASALAEHFRYDAVDVVVAPALGGIIIGHETARKLAARSIFTERENGQMKLRRGFQITPQERVLVVEDVVTTGGSTREVIKVVESAGGQVIAVGCIIDRSGGRADLGKRLVSLAVLQIPAYEPAACELCATGSLAVKPGSRGL